MKNLKLTTEELKELLIATDHRLEDFRILPYQLEQLDLEQQKSYLLTQNAYLKIQALLKTTN
jgi:hypothetical protein